METEIRFRWSPFGVCNFNPQRLNGMVCQAVEGPGGSAHGNARCVGSKPPWKFARAGCMLIVKPGKSPGKSFGECIAWSSELLLTELTVFALCLLCIALHSHCFSLLFIAFHCFALLCIMLGTSRLGAWSDTPLNSARVSRLLLCLRCGGSFVSKQSAAQCSPCRSW